MSQAKWHSSGTLLYVKRNGTYLLRWPDRKSLVKEVILQKNISEKLKTALSNLLSFRVLNVTAPLWGPSPFALDASTVTLYFVLGTRPVRLAYGIKTVLVTGSAILSAKDV